MNLLLEPQENFYQALDIGSHINGSRFSGGGELPLTSVWTTGLQSCSVPPVRCDRLLGLNGSMGLRGLGISFWRDPRRCRCGEARRNACSGEDYTTKSVGLPPVKADIHELGDAEATLGAS